MKLGKASLIWAVAIATGFPLCAQSLDGDVPVFRVAGPAALTDVLIPATLESFARENELTLRREIQGDDAFALALIGSDSSYVARFEFAKANSGQALEALIGGAIELAATTRPANDEEQAGIGPGSPVQVAGRDALVAIVSRSNPVEQISPNALAQILSGTITDWSELGGDPGPITLNIPEPDSGLGATIAHYLLDGGEVGGVAVTHASASELTDAVAADPLSLGVTRYSEVGNARALAMQGACGIVIAPTRSAIMNDDFPTTTPLFIYGLADGMPDVLRDYFDHLGSSAVQGPIRQAGFVDQMPERVPLEAMGGALANAIAIAGLQSPVSELRRFVDVLSGRERLSITFRFKPGTKEMDAASKSGARLLARALKAGFFDGSELIFAGFSDGVGGAAANLEVGRSRARAVEKAVRDLAGDLDGDLVSLSNNSFGETLPLACDDSEWGRHVNRRVEVWIDG